MAFDIDDEYRAKEFYQDRWTQIGQTAGNVAAVGVLLLWTGMCTLLPYVHKNEMEFQKYRQDALARQTEGAFSRKKIYPFSPEDFAKAQGRDLSQYVLTSVRDCPTFGTRVVEKKILPERTIAVVDYVEGTTFRRGRNHFCYSGTALTLKEETMEQ